MLLWIINFAQKNWEWKWEWEWEEEGEWKWEWKYIKIFFLINYKNELLSI